MTRAEAITKARKLRELARRGVDGERDNATRLFAAFMAREGLRDADLDGTREPDPVAQLFEEYMRDAHRYGGAPTPRGGYAEQYARAAIRAYAVTMQWVGVDPTRDAVNDFIRHTIDTANDLFP